MNRVLPNIIEDTNTPASVMDKRVTPRMSIAEINSLDMDELRNRFGKIKREDRTPVEQVLDLIDLPRNAIVNLGAAAVGADRQALSGGDTGTLGLPKITASDVLKGLGVKNRLVNGIVGFAGDVALDPLTYVGPAGWGAKLASGGGKSLSLTRRGSIALRRSIADVAAGQIARHPEWGEYLAAKGFSRLEGEAVPDAINRISREVYGERTGGALSKVFSTLGGEKTYGNASLVEDFYKPEIGRAHV